MAKTDPLPPMMRAAMSTPANQSARLAKASSVKHRILYLSEQLQLEKTSRDKNIVCYLKLVSKADRHKAAHIRQAFEKVNQRSSATIAHIECKLRHYHQQLQEMEEGNRPKCSSLKEKEANDKPPLLKNPKPRAEEFSAQNPLDVFEEDVLAAASPQEKSSKKGRMGRRQTPFLLKIKEELQDIKKSQSCLELSYQSLKDRYLSDLQMVIKSLQEEKYRQKVIEEQIGYHIQEHLGETSHIKQNLACTEEKMVYLSYEKAKEIWEMMGTFQNRISRLEIQQQAVQLEIMEKPRNYPLLFLLKFMSLLLTFTTILLICVSIICTCPLPFLRCYPRFCTILLFIGLGMITWQKWYSVLHAYWQDWSVPGWKLYSRDSKPLPSSA